MSPWSKTSDLGPADGGDSGEDGEQGRSLHHQVSLYPLQSRGTQNILYIISSKKTSYRIILLQGYSGCDESVSGLPEKKTRIWSDTYFMFLQVICFLFQIMLFEIYLFKNGVNQRRMNEIISANLYV